MPTSSVPLARRSALFAAVLLGLLAPGGCRASRPQVRGTVTYKGARLNRGTLTFID